jgi:branched-subunit amino acid permease
MEWAIPILTVLTPLCIFVAIALHGRNKINNEKQRIREIYPNYKCFRLKKS